MDILCPHEKTGMPEAAVFDFDGTLSKLRSGWELVMEPLMAEVIPGNPEELLPMIRDYIDKSTGIQTIHQMRWIAEQVTARGGQALDPWEYKAEYNRRLMEQVAKRREDIQNGIVPRNDYLVDGAENFLAKLKQSGVRLYAASGTDDPDVKEEARILGLYDYFEEINGASLSADSCSKEAVLKKLVKPGRRLLVVGDGRVEIALGKAAGALTLGVCSWDIPGSTPDGLNPDKARRLTDAGAHALCADFKEAEELFQWM
ncbi:MAG: HAD family hydrolase [Clostridia bacterium]|nr:HAD family hydrolase [Clostridia bacterium]